MPSTRTCPVLGAARVGPAGARDRIALGCALVDAGADRDAVDRARGVAAAADRDDLASCRYDRLVYATVPQAAAVDLRYAQYCAKADRNHIVRQRNNVSGAGRAVAMLNVLAQKPTT